MSERSCTDPRCPTVHFLETNSRALTPSTVAQKTLPIAAGVAVAAVASALLNRWLAQRSERRNPPIGRFITVDGVRLHYVERGTGTPLVLLHGNGSMIEDFQSSGLIDLAAKKYRVIAIDRPGFGHSDRPWPVIALALRGSTVAGVHFIRAKFFQKFCRLSVPPKSVVNTGSAG